MQQAHQGAMPTHAPSGENILTFPVPPGHPSVAGPAPAAEAPAADESQPRRRISGVALAALLLPATMLLMEVVRRMIEGG